MSQAAEIGRICEPCWLDNHEDCNNNGHAPGDRYYLWCECDDGECEGSDPE